eukprot:TRINITY_DN1790_c1_g1_i1.p1 TRINITY_DN1790_c1_g1~~TRINITY_DN1790_c1_g1_i1.p1  ORF type:complete len:577 (+),score=200.35 TRINITY_DN1790_c1_g1_i1:77-1807(+)
MSLTSMHAVLLLALAGARGDAAAKSAGGNILFLMCDSMDGRVLDPTSPVAARVEMPHLRGLSARGVNFARTYVSAPQCVPSRTSMFAGRHTHEIKAWSNEQGLAGIPAGGLDKTCVKTWGAAICGAMAKEQNVTFTMLDVMRDVGYDFQVYGKVDIGAGITQDKTLAHPTASGYRGEALNIMTRTADIRRATKADPLTITNDRDNNVHPEDQAMIPRCVDFLKQKAEARGAGAARAPWMMYCSLNIPHPAFQTNATWLAKVDDSKVDVPTWLDEAAFHPADSYMSESKAVWRNYTEAEILKVRKTYYAMCAETDYLLGKVLTALDVHGFARDTWVVFLSDHGEMNMEHRQVWKNSMYEASARVPMIIAAPEGMPGVRRGAVVTNLTSLLDVLPTMVDIAQTDIARPIPTAAGGHWFPERLSGHSVLPFLSAEADAAAAAAGYPSGRSLMAQYHSNMGNTGSFMYRSGPWKYVAFGRHAYDATYTPQLFNVEEDPEELRDLAAARPDVAARLDAALRAVVDYEAVDREARANDLHLYKHWLQGKSRKAIQKSFEMTYSGFDAADMAKVDAWVANGGQ